MCGNHSTVRGVLQELSGWDDTVVVDLEASPEHMTRATTEFVDHMLLIAEPYFKSLETARRYHALALDLGIDRVSVVGNKLQHDDREMLEDFCSRHGFDLIATIPLEPEFVRAERLGAAPYDEAGGSPGMEAIRNLANRVRGASQ